MERTVELPTQDGTMPVYDAFPEGEPREAVVVLQEAYGVNSYIEDVCRRLARVGYRAVAPHLYHRTRREPVPYGDVAKAIEQMATLSDETLLADVDAVLGYLDEAAIDRTRIGIVGFCMGGRATFLVAARREIGAAVGFYGGGIVTSYLPQFASLVGEAARLKTPWLGLFGDTDPSIPVADVEQLREALGDSPLDAQIVRYADAGHGFHSDQRDSYVPAAAEDGWARTLEWFERRIRG